MDIAAYHINLDALLARILFRWHWRVALGTLTLATLAGLAMGLIPPFWRGSATLTVSAASGAVVTVDGKHWPRAVYAGEHRVTAQFPDGRSSWADVTLVAGEAVSLTLPPGVREPRVRVLPASAPGMQVAQVWRADGGWRVLSQAAPAGEAGGNGAALPTATPAPGQVIAVTASGMERLATINAYGGLADQVHAGNTLIEAVFVPDARAAYAGTSSGAIEVRGWGAQTVTITVTHPLTLLRFNPAGDALLLAEQIAGAGEQVSLVRRDGSRSAVIAVPGQLTRLSWSADGRAVVLHSRQAERLTLTLVRLAPTIAAAVVADLDAATHAGDLAPLTWDASALLWVAPDDTGEFALWRAALTDLIPERVMALRARALAALPDGDLRVLGEQNGALVIGRYHGAQFYSEVVLASLTPADDLVGVWNGDELLLQGAGHAWLLDFSLPEKDH